MKKIIRTSIACMFIAVVTFGVFFVYFSAQTRKYNTQAEKNLATAQETLAAIPIWHKKLQTAQTMKVGIITDTHVHPSRINKENKADDASRYLKSQYATPLRNFVKEMNVFQPDFVVHIGDVIEGTNEKNVVGMQGLSLVKRELDVLQKPLHWVLGNHDLRAVTKEQFLQSLSQKELNYAFDAGDYRFVFLDGNKNVTLEELLADEAADEQKELDENDQTENENESDDSDNNGNGELDGDNNMNGSIPQSEITWLKEQLATDKRVFVFCHFPLFDKPIISADGYPKKSVPNAREMQNIFDEYRVDGVFAGHVEARMYFQDEKTHYYVMTGTKKSKTYPESYYELTINGGVPDVTMYYTPMGSLVSKSVDFENGEK